MEPRLHLQQRFLDWAAGQVDLRAVIQVGSLARQEGGTDSLSDLDLILFATTPEKYAADPDWIKQLGEIWLAVANQSSRGDMEWLVLFANGQKVDFLIVKATGQKTLLEMLALFPYHGVLSRGFRVLLNQTGVAFDQAQLPLMDPQVDHPTQDQFDVVVNRAILSAARTAKLIHRLDLWRGQQEMSHELRKQLLTMIEWHARAISGLHLDTWYDGRNMSRWADPRFVSRVPATFASLDAADMQRALEETIELTHLLAAEIAQALNLQYPNPGQAKAVSWVRSLV